ncbi:hypothetical protein S7711_07996 [Stachybotrys chartarum IBT 7711]|uniref:PAS domain-containing protein n=1 Tax=Stachybotrys chartarum (strain CBS 109288 / IBT 7711) TaxID=1280523 RepID=A0A084AFC1_STACB|nr:hypothetical protein S7711_07996 [Stachybotrys chartarum IBT 7711]KFA52645.1 hypothetical protein S40293_05435 [Stachybotrys chartarum IBT 40293]
MASSTPTPPVLNPWEARALDHQFPDQRAQSSDRQSRAPAQWRPTQDAVIFPGLYSATGFDIMNILLQVVSRPNPMIHLGPVDSSVALILCDLELPDHPIVYVSDSFCELTGYTRKEVLGRNCRFLQVPPPGLDKRTPAMIAADKVAVHRLRQSVQRQEEVQLQITNYKKDGAAFMNILSIIPVQLGSSGYRYAVGFQVQLE